MRVLLSSLCMCSCSVLPSVVAEACSAACSACNVQAMHDVICSPALAVSWSSLYAVVVHCLRSSDGPMRWTARHNALSRTERFRVIFKASEAVDRRKPPRPHIPRSAALLDAEDVLLLSRVGDGRP